MINEVDYVELGSTCADVFEALDQGTKGRQAGELNHAALIAIERLKTCVELTIPTRSDLLN